MSWLATEAVAVNALLELARTRCAIAAVTSAALLEASRPAEAAAFAAFLDLSITRSPVSGVTSATLLEASRTTEAVVSSTFLDPPFNRSAPSALASNAPTKGLPSLFMVSLILFSTVSSAGSRLVDVRAHPVSEFSETVELSHVVSSGSCPCVSCTGLRGDRGHANPPASILPLMPPATVSPHWAWT